MLKKIGTIVTLIAFVIAPNFTFAEDTTSTPLPVAEMFMGAEDAPLTIIEYASFTCPHCARFEETVMPQLKADYIDTGKVKFIFREVYFDKYGMWASMIARCAGPDRYFGVSKMIFETQSTWARAGGDLEIVNELSKIGRMAGLEADQLQACMQDADTLRALVGWYQENATRDEINSTPTLIIDGEKFSNMPYDELKAILDEKLGA
jgi:protein-disulfide isomerase